MCGRYSLAPEQSKEIAQIVAEVQARFGAASIHTGEIFPTNAALDKPMFRRSLLERRCIVPTTGFYEWDGQKRKYHFRLPGQDRLYLAGLWNTFQGEERFVILTTAPNDTIINVHDRMPVMLTDDEVTPWLHDTGMASAKLTALQPALEGAAV